LLLTVVVVVALAESLVIRHQVTSDPLNRINLHQHIIKPDNLVDQVVVAHMVFRVHGRLHLIIQGMHLVLILILETLLVFLLDKEFHIRHQINKVILVELHQLIPVLSGVDLPIWEEVAVVLVDPVVL
jgi:hypothetical protein